MKVTAALGACAALACGGYASPGWSLPAATGSVTCATPDGYDVEAFSCSTAYESGSRTLSPYATLTVRGSYPGDLERVPASALGVTDFDFVVNGPDPYAKVIVDIDARLHQSTVGIGYGFSEILVQATGDIFTGSSSAYKVICSMGCPDQSIDFSGTLQVTTNPGYIGSVDMEVEAGGSFSYDPNSGYAYADPYFYIDPSTPNADQYSITLSDGVGNGLAGVPEPGAWALMLIGVGLAGAGLRRSRQRHVLA